MIVIQPSYLLSGADFSTPRVGAYPLTGTVAASTQAVGFDDDFAASPYTDTAWRPTADNSNWSLTFAASQTVSYGGLAGHNLGTVGCTVLFQLYIGSSWLTRATHTPTDDSPILFLIAPTATTAIRYLFNGPLPTIAHMRAGHILTLPQRSQYVGSMAFDDGLTEEYRGNITETGQLVQIYETRIGQRATMEVQHISEAWHDTYLKPLRRELARQPAFFADRPVDYPKSVIYGRATQRPSVDRGVPNRNVSIATTFDIVGAVGGT